MFRVKPRCLTQLIKHYIDRVKTGVRGVGYVKVDESVGHGRRGWRRV